MVTFGLVRVVSRLAAVHEPYYLGFCLEEPDLLALHFGRIANFNSFHIVTFSTSVIALCTMVNFFIFICKILIDMSGEVRLSMYYLVTFLTYKSQLYASFNCFFRQSFYS